MDARRRAEGIPQRLHYTDEVRQVAHRDPRAEQTSPKRRAFRNVRYSGGVGEVGRAAEKRRASPHPSIVGIDEVGRGCLAGPVVVCAAMVPRGWRPPRRAVRGRGKLRDSKRLTKVAREEWFGYFETHPHISYAVSRVSPAVIDRVNVARAANVAALRAFKKLATSDNRPVTRIFLDGGLYLGNGRGRLPAETVIRGDETMTAIKVASIIAKVTRDRHMARLAKKYPQYGFEIHKGYGTRVHYAAIRSFGVSTAHRATFLNRSFLF